MPRYVAFLRGINLGKRRVAMARLREVFEGLGHAEVATFIASGNVIFDSPIRNALSLEKGASARLERELGYRVDVFLRNKSELLTVIDAAKQPNPGVTLHVSFFNEPVQPSTRAKLEAITTPTDRFQVLERELLWYCGIRSSDSEVWTLPEMKALRLPTSTMRNMTTVRKLVARHFEPSLKG